MSDSILSFENVCFSYGRQEILKDVSSEISTACITAVFGPNGSGKTTLLKIIAGLLRPVHGKICVNGKDIVNMSPGARGRLVSYVPQEHSLSFAYSVTEAVLMGRTPHLGGVIGPGKDEIELTKQALEAVGISDIADKPYTELSGGQRHLVLIARALAQGSDVMILDEPTAALDFKNQVIVWNKLKELRDCGKTILVCTHDPNHVTWFCDDVIVIKDGCVIQKGSAKLLVNDDMMNELYGSICTVKNEIVLPII